jgi:hypothetical protein
MSSLEVKPGTVWRSLKNFGDAVVTRIERSHVTYYMNGDLYATRTVPIEMFLRVYSPFRWSAK